MSTVRLRIVDNIEKIILQYVQKCTEGKKERNFFIWSLRFQEN